MRSHKSQFSKTLDLAESKGRVTSTRGWLLQVISWLFKTLGLRKTRTKLPRLTLIKPNSLPNLRNISASTLTILNHFHEVNKFIEDNHRYFYPPEDPDDYRFDVLNELVAEVDAQTHF